MSLAPPPPSPMTCLTMIVKNEAHVVARAVESVLPFIDCYMVVDTGSTDDTEEVAKHALRSKWGEYHHASWGGYGPARTRAIVLAEQMLAGRAAYAMVVDADDVWSGTRQELTDDAHAVWFVKPAAKWTTARFLRLGAGIRYEGVVHERPMQNGAPPSATLLEGIEVTSPNDGATWSEPQKYLEHARMIQRAMLEDPTNRRYAFYLAQSYRDHGDDEKASTLYLQRAAMGPGDEPEQVYVSFLEAGRALWRLGRMNDAKRALWQAHLAYPARREAMVDLARWFAVTACTSPPAGTLFVESLPPEASHAGA